MENNLLNQAVLSDDGLELSVSGAELDTLGFDSSYLDCGSRLNLDGIVWEIVTYMGETFILRGIERV